MTDLQVHKKLFGGDQHSVQFAGEDKATKVVLVNDGLPACRFEVFHEGAHLASQARSCQRFYS